MFPSPTRAWRDLSGSKAARSTPRGLYLCQGHKPFGGHFRRISCPCADARCHCQAGNRAATWARDYVDAGGLLSYGIRYHEMFEQGAAYIARILRGAHPRELPVVEASKFDIVLNSRTANALNLIVPPSVLIQATEVID